MLPGSVFTFLMPHFSSLLLFCKSRTPHKLIHNFFMMHGSRKTIMSSFKHRHFHSFSFVILLSLFLSSSFCRIFLVLLPVSGDTQASESTETSWSLHPKAPASDASSYGRQPTPSTGLVMCVGAAGVASAPSPCRPPLIASDLPTFLWGFAAPLSFLKAAPLPFLKAEIRGHVMAGETGAILCLLKV